MKRWIVILVVVGCNTVRDCDLVDTRTFALAEFYVLGTEDSLRKVMFTVTNPDSTLIYFDMDTSISIVTFPLDPGDTAIEYTLWMDTSRYDLRFSYNTQLYLYDEDCGPEVRMHLGDATSENMEVTVINPVLETDYAINVEISF